MNIPKEDNQYYAKYFEQAIESIVNKTPVTNRTNKIFTTKEENEMQSDAHILVNIIQPKKAHYIGDRTSLANGDLIIDDRVVEIKYVAMGSGTYFNTSVHYFESVGLPSFHNYLQKYNYFSFLTNAVQSMHDIKINVLNESPCNVSDSKRIRKEAPLVYQTIKKEEKKIRALYVDAIYKILKSNKNKLSEVAYDMITKQASGKNAPDNIMVFNHSTKSLVQIFQQELISLLDNIEITKKGDNTIDFGGFKITIAWQNGTGLNNPTIRVFLN